jgi:hypothetical protein
MATARDLGTRYTCFKCGTKFYDMKKPVPACPKCGADQRESPALKSSPPPERKKPAPAPVEDTEAVDEALLDEGEAEEEIPEEDEAEEEPE